MGLKTPAQDPVNTDSGHLCDQRSSDRHNSPPATDTDPENAPYATLSSLGPKAQAFQVHHSEQRPSLRTADQCGSPLLAFHGSHREQPQYEYHQFHELASIPQKSASQIYSLYPSWSFEEHAAALYKCLRNGGGLFLTCTRFIIDETCKLDTSSRNFWLEATDRLSIKPEDIRALREAGLTIREEEAIREPVSAYELPPSVSSLGVKFVQTIVLAQRLDHLKKEQIIMCPHPVEQGLNGDPGWLSCLRRILPHNAYQGGGALARLHYPASSSRIEEILHERSKQIDPRNDICWVSRDSGKETHGSGAAKRRPHKL